jgi:hypothetical protein
MSGQDWTEQLAFRFRSPQDNNEWAAPLGAIFEGLVLMPPTPDVLVW